ncbi:MAG: hypothetical protein HY518_02020 [Candidatus Aenigmarchaeota archaeon]|nr:hypothetical protein [Candidatus Aenigmarchaeota archaeon]
METKYVVFDLMGMVVTSEAFSDQYSRKAGLPRDFFLPFYAGAFQECLTGKADLKGELAPYLKAWKWEKSHEGSDSSGDTSGSGSWMAIAKME